MAKVGNIMARHNGANVAVADIYDQKVTISEIIPNYDVDDRPAFLNVHFDPVEGVIDDCGNTAEFVNQNSLVEISTNHAVCDYSAHFSNKAFVFVTFSSPVAIGETDFTFDGWFYKDTTSTVTQTWLFTPHQGGYSCYAYIRKKTSSTVEVAVKLGGVLSGSSRSATISSDFLNSPFHFAYVYTISDTYNYVFINGDLIFRTKLANSATNKMYSFRICSNSITPADNSIDVYCSWFRYSRFARWTETFVPPVYSTVAGNGYLPVYHNNQSFYAPLVTAPYKQPPCIAVRHNNQTYYTVRS